MTDKRKRKLRLRLKELGMERLKQAYIAVSKSAWHRGDNPSGWSIDNKDVYWLVENAERAEEWANKYEISTNKDKDGRTIMDLSTIDF